MSLHHFFIRSYNMKITANEIASKVNGRLEGDPDLIVDSIATIESQTRNSLTFLANPKYLNHIYSEIPRCILVATDFKSDTPTAATLIYVPNVYASYADVSHWMAEHDSISLNREIEKISSLSSIHTDVVFGESITVGDFTKIKSGTKIGSNTVIGDQVYIGMHVVLGERTILMSGVKIMDSVEIGNDCIVYPNAVIGTDGFGHVMVEGKHVKIPHSGTVIIEDHVEIGSGTVIDRGSIRNTIIRKGAKLDNLIQVAHGVEIGEGVVIAAQTGISGSSKIGKGSMLGGQVGIAGHLTIAPGSQIQAKSGVSGDITEPNQKWYGYPILSYHNYLRSYAIFKKLPDILKSEEDLKA
ncbi:MAG: UDP-3-O-[3-hydroxymyristoyl] glucosamine N-acyltransferase [Saprospiraceae bacterium]|jgi:UDP-3-O-[3-hydroxymyristoyl] glucosamine N-acyltransferase